MKKSLAKEREQGNHRHDKNKEEEYSDKKRIHLERVWISKCYRTFKEKTLKIFFFLNPEAEVIPKEGIMGKQEVMSEDE